MDLKMQITQLAFIFLFFLVNCCFADDDVCSDAIDLNRRVSQSLLSPNNEKEKSLQSLRGILDNVATEEECRYLVNELQPERFVSSLGYENNSHDGSSYNAPVGYSGLGLKELALPSSPSENEYDVWNKLLELRERMRHQTEMALGLCNKTLFVHYTQIAQKTSGGKHHPHADNCFHNFDNKNKIASCDETKQHPWPMRSAASILFLNEDFGGGEFYWADLHTGEPDILVKAKPGKMTYFTSGPENLHGALPVEEEEEDPDEVCTTPAARRLVLAMWYTTNESEAEIVPKFGEDEQEDPNAIKLFDIPIASLRKGALRLTLGLYFLGQQNTPSTGSWALNQPDDSMLTMLFKKDHSAMLSVTIKENSIVMHRHVDSSSSRPSLQYQLQESVLLHGFLDELDTLAFGGDEDNMNMRREDRLLVPLDDNAIERCRETLPARRA